VVRLSNHERDCDTVSDGRGLKGRRIHVNTFVAFAIALSSISPHSLNLRLISSSIFARRVLADQEAPRFFLPRRSNLTVPGICLLDKTMSALFKPS
jgi:hypothetical protein